MVAFITRRLLIWRNLTDYKNISCMDSKATLLMHSSKKISPLPHCDVTSACLD